MRRLITVLAGTILFMIMTGCNAAHGGEQVEITSFADALPTFLDVYSDQTQHLYAQAVRLEPILRQMPCYCGCMTGDPNEPEHQSLFQCFILDLQEDQVTWTDHGAQCGICLLELQDVDLWDQQGFSPDEILEKINDKYQR